MGLAVNSAYWLGAMLGAAANLVFLDTDLFGADLGWRVGLLVGPAAGMAVWRLRRRIPESPRWLIASGRPEQAEQLVRRIEADIERRGLRLDYRRRALLCLALMAAQSFLYNAILFTYPLILAEFYAVEDGATEFIFLFALANLPVAGGRRDPATGGRGEAEVTTTQTRTGALTNVPDHEQHRVADTRRAPARMGGKR